MGDERVLILAALICGLAAGEAPNWLTLAALSSCSARLAAPSSALPAAACRWSR
jgi:hypothetical protein